MTLSTLIIILLCFSSCKILGLDILTPPGLDTLLRLLWHLSLRQCGLIRNFRNEMSWWNTFQRFKNEAIRSIIDGGYITWNKDLFKLSFNVLNLEFWCLIISRLINPFRVQNIKIFSLQQTLISGDVTTINYGSNRFILEALKCLSLAHYTVRISNLVAWVTVMQDSNEYKVFQVSR